jgi:nucleoside-diphosphate-sugar epimerase
MRIFLAGGTGVIGRRVIPLLLADGHRVTVLTRTSAGAAQIEASGASAVVGDAFNAAQLRAVVCAAAPDVVMHQLTDLSAGDRVANAALRVHGTRNLVDAARAAGVARLIAQSIAWAYEPGDVPASEATPLDVTADEPRRSTVEAVAALEAAVAEADEWVVLRYGTLYGPGTWLHHDGATADDARAGRLVASRDVTSFLHVEDAAAAALNSLNWPSGYVNICDDEPAQAAEWMPALCRALHAPPPQPSGERAGWARGADNDHARKLGFEPRYPSWRDGLLDGELAGV